MAASTLANINWNDLDSAEMTTAVRLLAHATQERFNIAMMTMAGVFVGADIPRSNFFPFELNTPDWSLDAEGGPLADFSTEVETLISRMITRFADIEKWNDADTNGETNDTRYILSMAADAPGTYDNRLFELIGDTTNSYPDLSVYAPEEVKKWYDMLAECSYILREHTEGENDDFLIFDGSFDVEQGTFFAADVDGANFFGIDETNYELVSNTTPYSNFKTEQNALFGTKPDTYNTKTDSGTYPPDEFTPFEIRVARESGSGDYVSWTRCVQVTYVADWTDSRAAVGFNGRPQAYKHQHKANETESFPAGQDPNYSFPSGTTANNQRYYTINVLTENGDTDEIAVDHGLSSVTVPTNITDISAGQEVTVKVEVNNNFATWFLEDWDQEGGFDSYIS